MPENSARDKSSREFTLPVGQDVAIDLVRAGCFARGWPIERLTEREVAAIVTFHTKKASVALTFTPTADGTAVKIDGHVIGVGDAARRMLQEKLDSFQASLIHQAERELPYTRRRAS
jgi:hypothetical protein